MPTRPQTVDYKTEESTRRRLLGYMGQNRTSLPMQHSSRHLGRNRLILTSFFLFLMILGLFGFL